LLTLADPEKRQEYFNKYSNIFWSEENAPQQVQEAANLFLETALAVNTARVLHRLHDPEGKKRRWSFRFVSRKRKSR